MTHVVNYDLPQDIYEYINRIGRTGRVGNKGRATSFFYRKIDDHLATDLADCLQRLKQPVPEFLKSGGEIEENKFE